MLELWGLQGSRSQMPQRSVMPWLRNKTGHMEGNSQLGKRELQDSLQDIQKAIGMNEFRDWIIDRMEWCFAQATYVEQDALTRGDVSYAERVFLWRARGTVYSEVLKELDSRGLK